MSEEFGPNFITLTDEDGNEIELEYVDAIEVDALPKLRFEQRPKLADAAAVAGVVQDLVERAVERHQRRAERHHRQRQRCGDEIKEQEGVELLSE